MKALLKILVLVMAVNVTAAESENDPSSRWKKGGSSNWWSLVSRDAALKELEPRIQPGLPADELRTMLGDPQSKWRYSKGEIWTYGVHRGRFLQVLIGPQGRVAGSARRNYSSEIGAGQLPANEREVGSFYDVAMDVGCWQATIKPYVGPSDRSDIGRRAFRFVTAKMGCDEVENAFGIPFFTEQTDGRLVWVYRMGPSKFMLIAFTSEKEVTGVQERIYYDGSGQADKKDLLSPSEPVDDKTADLAAWRATWKDYTRIDDRRGIGKRMETYIKAGMTKEDVEKLMGKPERVGSNRLTPLIWSYDLHTDSVTVVDFDVNGVVVAVRHVGT